MAIQLNTQTAQQQKAPFSAFDTTSSYRSGLTGVSQGLDKVASAASNIQGILTKQKDESQRLLSSSALSAYDVELDKANNELSAAISQGKTEEIEAKREAFNLLQTPDFNSFLGPDAGGTITNDKILSEYAQRGSVAWQKANNKHDSNINSAIVSRQAVDYLGGTGATSTEVIVNNPAGMTAVSYGSVLSKLSPESESFSLRKEALRTQKEQEAFVTQAGNSAFGTMLHQLKTASSVGELSQRKEQIDAFNTGEGAGFGFSHEKILQLEAVNNTVYKAVSNPEYLVVQAQKQMDGAQNSFDALDDLTEASDMGSATVAVFNTVTSLLEDPFVVKKHGDKLQEMNEVLSVLLPELDETGVPTGEPSVIDQVIRRGILYTEDNRPSMADILQKVDGNVSLEEPSRNKLQGIINDRISLVEKGLSGGDLTSLGVIFPKLQQLINTGDMNKVRVFYQQNVKPEMTAEGLDAGVYGLNIGGNISLPAQFGFIADTPAFPVKDVTQSSAAILNVLKQNEGFEGAGISVAIRAINDPATTEAMAQTHKATILALNAAKRGQDPSTILTDVLTFASKGEQARSDSGVMDLYKELKLVRDTGNPIGNEVVDTIEIIEHLEGSPRWKEARFYEDQLLGVIKSKVAEGSSMEDIVTELQTHEDKYIRPYLGSLREVREGQVAYIHPDVYNENVNPEHERAGLFGSVLNIFGESDIFSFKGKTGAAKVANHSQSAIIAYAVKNFDLSDMEAVMGDMDFGFRDIKNQKEGNVDSQAALAVGGATAGSTEPSILSEEQIQHALYLGLLNNDYFSQGYGFLGPKGEGVPIARVSGTTFRTEIDDATKVASEQEYYVLEVLNPRTEAYVPFQDNKGQDVIVPVQAVSGNIRKGVLNDVNFNPFDSELPSVFNSGTSVQNSMWDIVTK